MRHGFHILGPVELWAGGRQVDLGSGKQRAVLAMLVLGAGRPCSAETLIDRLWGEDPPAQARNTLYSYATLRRRLVDDLGAEPGPALQRLHLQILRSEEPVAASGSDEVTVVLNRLADAGLIGPDLVCRRARRQRQNP